jgi:hypothetical protein
MKRARTEVLITFSHPVKLVGPAPPASIGLLRFDFHCGIRCSRQSAAQLQTFVLVVRERSPKQRLRRARRETSMRFRKTSSWAIGIAVGFALIASAAEASPLHSTHDERYAPHEYGRTYDATPEEVVGTSVPYPEGMRRAYDATPEEFFGTSVPYDPDGPGYNDFQLQGTGE